MVQTQARPFHVEFDGIVGRADNGAMRNRSFLVAAGLLMAVAPAAFGQAGPSGAVPLGPNPSECEIQAALLGVAGPGCPPLRMQRPAPPPPAVAAPAPSPSSVKTPPMIPPVAVPALAPLPPEPVKPELRAAFRVEFDFNSTVIRPESRTILDRLGAVMTAPAAGAVRFRIVGHTDAVGGDAANLGLSERRAKAVVAYLVAQHHIAPGRLEASGRGARDLLLPDQPKAAANRRVEIINLGE